MLLDPTLATSRVGLIHPQMFETGKLLVSAFQQQRHGRAILDVGSVHFGAKNETARIDQDVALAAIHALGTIIATHATDTGRPHRLAIDNACARVGVAPDAGAELLTEDSVDVFPCAIHAPQREVVVGGLPGRKLMRQQPPGTATPNDVEDGVQDLSDRMQPRSPEGLGRR
jgi:hypothetical protein